jgi:putative glycosyltransferase (TIGR04372 family)
MEGYTLRGSLKRFLGIVHYAIGVLIGTPFATLIRLIDPFVRVRVGPLRSNIIGHFVFDLEYHLSCLDASRKRDRTLAYYTHSSPVNSQWDKMVRRVISVRQWYRYIDWASCILPGSGKHKLFGTGASRDLSGVLMKYSPHVYFTSKEEKLGRQFLEEIGCGSSREFIFLIVRDSAYKNSVGGRYHKNKDWSYHDYRNSEIDSYKDAVRYLIDQGYSVIRGGSVVENPLLIKSAHFFDYATSGKTSDLLDIWLAARCRFVLSTCTGLDEVSRVFCRAAVYVNFLPLVLVPSYSQAVSAPKRLFWRETGKELTMDECIKNPFLDTLSYERADIQIRDLESIETLEVVIEGERRLRKKWQTDEQNVLDQSKFWCKLKEADPEGLSHGKIHKDSYISSCFLQRNPNWL